MSALRKLWEAAYNGLLDPVAAQGIRDVRAAPGAKASVPAIWLTKKQTEALINKPYTETLKGKRDRAMLAVMIGWGLRRGEVAGGPSPISAARWPVCIADLRGKRRTRPRRAHAGVGQGSD